MTRGMRKYQAVIAVAVLAIAGAFVICEFSNSDTAGTSNEAKIGTHEYSTLSLALAGANSGETVILLKSCTLSDSIGSGVTLQIDNGLKLTIQNGASWTNNGTIINKGTINDQGTLTNKGIVSNYGTINGAGTIKADNGSHAVVMYAGTLTGVTVDANNSNGIEITTSATGAITIDDCTIILGTDAADHGIYVNPVPYRVIITDVKFNCKSSNNCPINIDASNDSELIVSGITVYNCTRTYKVLINATEDLTSFGEDIEIDADNLCLWSENGYSFTIPEDGQMTVSEGYEVTLYSGSTLINNGDMDVDGILTNKGIIYNYGALEGTGTIMADNGAHAIVMYAGTLTGVTVDANNSNGIEITTSATGAITIDDCAITLGTDAADHGIYVNPVSYQVTITDVEFNCEFSGKCPINVDASNISKLDINGITFNDCIRTYKVLINAIEDLTSFGEDIEIDADDLCLWSENGYGFAIPEDGQMTVSEGYEVTLYSGTELINNGLIIVNGTLIADPDQLSGSGWIILSSDSSYKMDASTEFVGNNGTLSINGSATIKLGCNDGNLRIKLCGEDGITLNKNYSISSDDALIIEGSKLIIPESKTITGKVSSGSNSAVFVGLTAGEDGITISEGSLRISGIVDASSNVSITSSGDVKLNGTVIGGTYGKLTVETMNDGLSEFIIEDLTVESGAIVNIADSATVSGDLTIKNGAKLQNDGSITISPDGKVVNNGSIESSVGESGTIQNAGMFVNNGSIGSSINVVSISVDQVRFNIAQKTWKVGTVSKNGLYITVMPDSKDSISSVKQFTQVCVKYTVSKYISSEVGTLIYTVTIDDDDDAMSIRYADGNAYVEVDLSGKGITATTSMWVEYTFQLDDDEQLTAVSDMFKFNPSRTYCS